MTRADRHISPMAIGMMFSFSMFNPRNFSLPVRAWRTLMAACVSATLMASEARGQEVEVEPLLFGDIFTHRSGDTRSRLVGALQLRSSSTIFGGFSGLALSPDGSRLMTVSDRGGWMTAALTYDDTGRVVGVHDVALGRLRGLEGRSLESDEEADAESLTIAPDGSLLVTFESKNRIFSYRDGLDGIPKALFNRNTHIKDLGNHGIEASVALADGTLFAIGEGWPSARSSRAYLISNGKLERLSYQTDADFRPVGAAQLPRGDVLVLERAFSNWTGFQSRIRRIEADRIMPGAHLQAREVLTFGLDAALFNFEGIAAHEGPNGLPRITLISDDNFHPMLPTAVIMIELLD